MRLKLDFYINGNMFGVSIGDVIENAPQIAEGAYNSITNRENDLYESRIKICRECQLFGRNPLGEVCDAKKCWDTKLNKLVNYPGEGVICGCGCKLGFALRTPGKKCVLNKW